MVAGGGCGAPLPRTRLAPVLYLALFLAGCGDPTEPAADPPDDPDAEVLHLVDVEANQGVAVALVQEGEPVPLVDRNAPLIEDRPILIRARWEVGSAWTSRSIRAELHLTDAAGAHGSFTETRWVDQRPSTLADPDRNFAWEVPAEWAREEVTLRIETDSGGTDPLPMGVEPGEMVIRVTVVPVGHDFEESCAEIPSLTPTDVETLGELLHRRNPTQRVEMTLREPFIWSESLDRYTGLLAALSQLRFEDGAHPAEYYAGLVHHCVRTGGQAITIPAFPTLDNGWTRTVVSAWRGAAPLTSTTFVHEMGHAQGRAHVRCTGSEGAPDPNYPYPAGNIGVWGWSLNLEDARMNWLSGNLYHPVDSNDYMGYCTGPQHVSDYGWRQVAPFIHEISGWDASAAHTPSEARLLVALAHPGEDLHWFEVPGRPTPDAAGPTGPESRLLVLDFDDSLPPVELHARVLPSTAAGGEVLEVALPSGRGIVTAVRGVDATDASSGRSTVAPGLPSRGPP